MDDVTALVTEAADRLFRDHMTHTLSLDAEGGHVPAAFWDAVEAAGLTLAFVPEEAGGPGVDPVAAAGLVRRAGYHAVPLPLAETMLANRLLASAGFGPQEGMLSVARTGAGTSLTLRRAGRGWHLSGVAARVPWGRAARLLAVTAQADGVDLIACVPCEARITPGENLAGEPRDDLAFDLALPEAAVRPGTADLDLLGAALRSLALAGALDRVLDLTTAYVSERVQFGRPLSKFQAVQQQVAALAGQVAAAGGAAGLAAEAFAGAPDPVRVACAKVRTGEAAGIAAGIAHQMHGAMGYSQEHSLHLYTRRLWAWREEFGNEAHWSRRLGAIALDQGADGLWPFIAAA